MTTAEKLQKSAAYMARLDDKNKELEKRLNGGEVVGGSYYDKFWDAWQNYGNRTDYQRGFAGWTADMADFLRPKYDIRPTNAYMMFGSNQALTDLPAWCADCGIELDFGQCMDFNLFLHDSYVVRMGTVDSRKCNNFFSALSGANNLKTIDKVVLISDGSQTYTNSTFNCPNLENITLEGVIGNNIWFKDCKNLTTASLLSILTALSKDSTLATGKTITLATAHKAKIEADAACTAQLNAAIAAGWTVAYV